MLIMAPVSFEELMNPKASLEKARRSAAFSAIYLWVLEYLVLYVWASCHQRAENTKLTRIHTARSFSTFFIMCPPLMFDYEYSSRTLGSKTLLTLLVSVPRKELTRETTIKPLTRYEMPSGALELEFMIIRKRKANGWVGG